MTRAPAHLARPGREAIWAAIRSPEWRHGRLFTVAQIARASGANDKTVRDYLKGLEAAGYLQHEAAGGEGYPARWGLVRDIGVEAPRVRADGRPVTQGVVTEQLWRGMSILKDFTTADLLETASVRIPAETAKSYCQLLLACGYLRVLKRAEPVKGRLARYRLVRNLGPRPPQVQRVKQVWDPNTGEVFHPEGRA